MRSVQTRFLPGCGIQLACAGLLLAACASYASGGPELAPYPVTAEVAQVDDYHGISVADPYRWLEDLDSADTAAWVEAQNEVSFSYLEDLPGRSRIRARMEELWNYERFSTPTFEGGRRFYTRNDGLQNQSVLYVVDSTSSSERVLLDPNTLSADGTVSMSGWSVSHDGRYLAYALSEGGSDWREWHVRDIDNGRDLADVIRWTKFTGATWGPDNKGFYYTGYPEPEGDALSEVNENATVYFHVLGSGQEQDQVIFQRPDQPRWGFGTGLSDDGRWLFVSGSEGTERKNRLWARDLAKGGDFVGVFLEFDAQYTVVGTRGDDFYVQTTLDAPLGRVFAVQMEESGPGARREIIAQQKDALGSVAYLGHKLVASYLHEAYSQLRVHDLDGRHLYYAELPTMGSLGGISGRWDDDQTWFSFSSFTFPPSIYHLDLGTGATHLEKRPVVPFDPARYSVHQVWYPSKDGTRVPMFLVHRSDLERNGEQPTLLYGYGGFNISMTPRFQPALITWLEMGGVYAMPNLRGGGEFGHAWHEAGTVHDKQNVFDDFIAAAEWLIDQGYTHPERLAIRGGSNGGLLVGACMTQRPDLYGACLPAVGVLDMLRYHRFTIGWAWASDYGTSDDAAQFRTLMRYSPLHNVRPGTAYPPTLITTGDHDDRVVPSHSFKFASTLQQAQAGAAPVLIRIETRGGHGGGKPTSMILDELADQWAFLAFHLGIQSW